MPDELIEEMEALAYQNDISFNQLVIQCCEYALANMHTDKKELDIEKGKVEKSVKE